MTGPDGTEQVFLAKGDALVQISPGTTLDDGYVVDSITYEAIVLTFTKSGTSVSIPSRSAAQ